MKAAILKSFDGIESVEVTDVPIPKPKSNEVQIKVAYAGVNPVDWKISEGYLKERMPYEFPIELGWDVSGFVSELGSDVTDLKIGDEVFGYMRGQIVKWGSFAEFTCVDANSLVKLPIAITLEEAAAFPLAALTAWQSLFEAAKLEKGENVLILAGAGGVGSMALQFAKNKGAFVLTTASRENHPYVRQLGADLPIDYHHEDVVKRVRDQFPEGVDLLFDTLGGDNLEAVLPAVKKGGRVVSILEKISEEKAAQHNIKAFYVFVRPEKNHLQQIADLIDEGKVVPPYITELPLEKVRDALEKVKEGHTRGKVVLRIG